MDAIKSIVVDNEDPEAGRRVRVLVGAGAPWARPLGAARTPPVGAEVVVLDASGDAFYIEVEAPRDGVLARARAVAELAVRSVREVFAVGGFTEQTMADLDVMPALRRRVVQLYMIGSAIRGAVKARAGQHQESIMDHGDRQVSK